MTPHDDYEIAFDSSEDLTSEVRRESYKTLLKFADHYLLNARPDRLRGLKRLYFEGLVSREHESELGAWEPLLVCLCSPSIDKGFVLQAFEQNRAACAKVAVQGFVDGVTPDEFSEIFARYRFIVLTILSEESTSISSQEDSLRFFYASFVRYLFDVLSRGGSSEHMLGVELFASFDRSFDLIEKECFVSERSDYLNNTLAALFSGKAKNPDAVYQDRFLMSFCARFFAKQLSPGFQAFCEGIYSSTSRYERIGSAEGAITYRKPVGRGFKSLGTQGD